MDYTEEKLRRVNTHKGIIVDVETDMIRLQNGAITMREVVRHPGGVCVVALDADGCIWLVRQFRYPFQRHLWELPAGKLEPGEEPLPAARRELSEETGLEAETWTPLSVLYATPGYCTEKLHLFLAEGLRHGEAHPDPNELLDVERVPLDEVLARIERGEIHDAKTVAGALLADRRRRGN
jgi:ADP-ribose pyrophosphatase